MSDEQLADLLVFGMTGSLEIPDCSYGCEHKGDGCAWICDSKQKERAVMQWLKEEETIWNIFVPTED